MFTLPDTTFVFHLVCLKHSRSVVSTQLQLPRTKECKSLTIKGVYTSVEENPAQRLNAELDDKNNSSDE